jgi:hypothetical protein
MVTWILGSGSAAGANRALPAFSLVGRLDPEFMADAAFFI